MTYDEKVRWLRRYRDALRLEEELRQELEAQRHIVPATPRIMKMVRKRFLDPRKSATAPKMGPSTAAISREIEVV